MCSLSGVHRILITTGNIVIISYILIHTWEQIHSMSKIKVKKAVTYKAVGYPLYFMGKCFHTILKDCFFFQTWEFSIGMINCEVMHEIQRSLLLADIHTYIFFSLQLPLRSNTGSS